MTRAFSDALDILITAHEENPIKIGNAGTIRVLDYMGNDQAIVDAARTSYGKGTKTVQQNAGLINYLMENKHTSPFEMAILKLHIKCPIFVARQLVRHRMSSMNEYSARYSVVEEEFYIPDLDYIAEQSTDNKQGRGQPLSEKNLNYVKETIRLHGNAGFAQYKVLLEDFNVARELARIILPLSTYTQFVWKIDLHNLLHFLELRMDPHAQQEIRDFANAIYMDIVKPWVPQTAEAFERFKLNSVTIEKAALEQLLKDAAKPPCWRNLFKRASKTKLVALMGSRRANALIDRLKLNWLYG